ncbi:MAG: TniQ family protein [Lachnospiraceae bacterium]|nr:TniQ family protein [Lachnospiraceae bacterium]
MSIACFPEIYPDELVYSVLARFYVRTGYLTYIFCAEELLVNKRVRPDIEFINDLKPEIVHLLCQNISIEQLIEKHTMFPYYARFLSKERRNRAFDALCNMSGDYNNLLGIPKQKNGEQRYLRYCPLCAEYDRSVYGESYWHRKHQLMGVKICPRHNCRLINSSVLICGKVCPDLVSAEQEIKEQNNIVYGNRIEQQLAEYIDNVFMSDVDMENGVEIGKFLYSRMSGTKYVSVRGKQRNIKLFTDDFITYYKDLSEQGLTELWQIQKVLTSYRINTFEVCQLAMFLKISVEDIVSMSLFEKTQEQTFDEKVKRMHNKGIGYNKIARELGVSSRTVRLVGKQNVRAKKNYTVKCGVKPKNWEQIDKETLPLVKEAIKQLQGTKDERPHKVTEYAVCRLLELPDKRLKLLPQCKGEVLKYQESQEQYWAKEIVWAVHKIQKEGEVLNWKKIRVLTNMRKRNLIASLPYLEKIAEPELLELVKSVL